MVPVIPSLFNEWYFIIKKRYRLHRKLEYRGSVLCWPICHSYIDTYVYLTHDNKKTFCFFICFDAID